MTDSNEALLRAISQLRTDIFAMREEVRPLDARLGHIEGQYAEIVALLGALKAGQPDAPKKAEFVSKRG